MPRFIITRDGFAALVRGDVIKLQDQDAGHSCEIKLDEDIAIGTMQHLIVRAATNARKEETAGRADENLDEPHNEAAARDIQKRQIKEAERRGKEAERRETGETESPFAFQGQDTTTQSKAASTVEKAIHKATAQGIERARAARPG